MNNEFQGIFKWLVISVLIMLLLALPLTWLCNLVFAEDGKQPVMACADLSSWNGEISFYKWNGVVQFNTTPATIDRASILEWTAAEVDYYATFEPLAFVPEDQSLFRFEAVINFAGTKAHLWIVSNGVDPDKPGSGDYWAWPFASYELGSDGNAHPCGSYQIESYEHQLLFGAVVSYPE